MSPAFTRVTRAHHQRPSGADPFFLRGGLYGLRVHEGGVEKGVKVTGATVHFVNEIPDGRIIAQKAVCVETATRPSACRKSDGAGRMADPACRGRNGQPADRERKNEK
ncbi:MAG: formyltransferase family protein [Acutalibacteraceae bacterium]